MMVDLPRPNPVTMASRSLGQSPTDCGSLGDWYVVATEHRAEHQVANALRALPWSPQVLVPLIREMVRQPHRPPIRQTLLAFPGYVLALWRQDDPWHCLLSTRGVAGVLHEVGSRDRPARLPRVVVHALLAQMDAEGILRSAADAEPAPIAHGAPVLVDGTWAGICEQSAERRISVLIGQVRLTVPRSRVVPA